MPPESLAAVQVAWKRLVDEDLLDVRGLRAEVASSWRRCRDRGLDPLLGQEVARDRSGLSERLRLKEELLRAARPSLDCLYQFVRGGGYQVILADEEGFLLEVLCDREGGCRAGENVPAPGDDCSEGARGTNAIGAAIIETKAVQISAWEHFLKRHHSLSCSAAPIFDPEGKLTGVLGITCHQLLANDHTLGMVLVAVHGIESQLRLRREADGVRMEEDFLHKLMAHASFNKPSSAPGQSAPDC